MSYRRNQRRRRINRKDPAIAPALASSYADRRIKAVARIKHLAKIQERDEQQDGR